MFRYPVFHFLKGYFRGNHSKSIITSIAMVRAYNIFAESAENMATAQLYFSLLVG